MNVGEVSMMNLREMDGVTIALALDRDHAALVGLHGKDLQAGSGPARIECNFSLEGPEGTGNLPVAPVPVVRVPDIEDRGRLPRFETVVKVLHADPERIVARLTWHHGSSTPLVLSQAALTSH